MGNDRRQEDFLPWLGIGLGILGVSAGLGGNSAVLLLGLAAVVLGIRARAVKSRELARWAVGLGGLAVVGYIGIIAQAAQQ